MPSSQGKDRLYKAFAIVTIVFLYAIMIKFSQERYYWFNAVILGIIPSRVGRTYNARDGPLLSLTPNREGIQQKRIAPTRSS